MIGPAATRTSCLLLLTVCGAGCASWTAQFDSEKVAAERARYGATADQRIADLTAEAGKANKASGSEQIAFSRKLTTALLEEHDPRVRAVIVELAARFDTPAAVAICRGGLDDPDSAVRMAACEAWRTRGGPEAADLLGARVNADDDIDVRLKALRELGDLGDDAAVPTLARALEDPDPAIQYRAVAALREISGRDLGNDVNAWRAWAADPDAEGNEWTIAEGFRQLF